MNSGDVIVGAIGCDMKLEYTSIGETTNLANRMESACEIGHVMLARGTYERLDLERFKDVMIDSQPREVMVKGYAEPVAAYRVMIDKLRVSKRSGAEVTRFYRYAIVEGENEQKSGDFQK
jgi:class 3 adenylate cyclase